MTSTTPAEASAAQTLMRIGWLLKQLPELPYRFHPREATDTGRGAPIGGVAVAQLPLCVTTPAFHLTRVKGGAGVTLASRQRLRPRKATDTDRGLPTGGAVVAQLPIAVMPPAFHRCICQYCTGVVIASSKTARLKDPLTYFEGVQLAASPSTWVVTISKLVVSTVLGVPVS